MNLRKHLLASVMLAALAISQNSARAQVVSFNFSGTLGNVSNPYNLLPNDITVGTPFSGTVTYNPSQVQDNFPADANNGVYLFAGAVLNDFYMTVTVGSHTLTWNPAPNLPTYIQAQMASSHLLDYGARDPFFDSAPSPGTGGDLDMHVTLWDSSKTALTSDAIPLSPPDLSKFDSKTFYYTRHNTAEGFNISGTIDTITPVPEPATTGLAIAAGLGGFALWQRRSSKLRRGFRA